MKRILVTGGLGVVGSRFVDEAVARGYNCTILDCGSHTPRGRWTMNRFSNSLDCSFEELTEFARNRSQVHFSEFRIEAMDLLDLRYLIEQHDLVLHAAAHTGIPHSTDDPGDDWRSNVDATRNLLEAMRIGGLKIPCVMLSSVKPYGLSQIRTAEEGDRTVGFVREPDLMGGKVTEELFQGVDESFPLVPDEPYAASKMAQSALGMAYARSYGLPVTVLRCSNLYGDAPCHGPRHGWLTWFCICAALGWPIKIQGTGKQTRDMLFCTDVANAVFRAFDHMDQLSGNVYNIGGGLPNTISVLEAVKKLVETIWEGPNATSGSRVLYAPGRQNEDALFFTNHQAFTSLTGWNPIVSVDGGMRLIYNWACTNRESLRKVYEEFAP